MNNKKGFTLVELIIVIGLLALAATLVGSQFFGLLGKGGKTDDFEDKELARGLAEAAYVAFEDDYSTSYEHCFKASDLVANGSISDKQGLLKTYTKEELENFSVRVFKDDGEKKTEVYKSSNCGGDPIEY